jgi:hypothetical protein
LTAKVTIPMFLRGSANFSGNSLHKNNENLLEITKFPRLGKNVLH